MIINSQPSGGGIYITNIAPTTTGTVSNIIYEDDIVLKTCDSDTLSITVSVLALSGPTRLKPIVYVNNIEVSNLTLNSDKRWSGSVAVTLTGTGDVKVIASYQDGGFYESTMSIVSGPVVTAFELTGGYPGSQTELKSGDTFNITFTTDTAINLLEVSNEEAAQAKTEVLSGTSNTTSITIANRGAGTYSNQRVKIRCRGTNNIYGDWVYSDVYVSGDGSAYVQLNNDSPTISAIAQGNITYPTSQSALKDSESATVNHTITCNGDFTVAYTSQNGDISISNSTTYETAKSVTRISGNYNISSNNLLITAIKTTNNKSSTRTAVIYIAHTAHTVALTLPYSRLRSSPAGSNYTLTLTASQRLLNAPTLNDLNSGEGTWGGSFSGSNTIWTRTLTVADTDTKGTFTFAGLVSTNLAGKVVNTITSGSSYIIINKYIP